MLLPGHLKARTLDPKSQTLSRGCCSTVTTYITCRSPTGCMQAAVPHVYDYTNWLRYPLTAGNFN